MSSYRLDRSSYINPTPKQEPKIESGFSDKVSQMAHKIWENKGIIIPVVLVLGALAATLFSPGQLSLIGAHYDVYIAYALGVAIISGGLLACLMKKGEWALGLLGVAIMAIIATTFSYILSTQAQDIISNATNPFDWKVVVAAGILGASPLIGYGLHRFLKEEPKPIVEDL